jgi:flagella basal body P-ring formation protein FlgA
MKLAPTIFAVGLSVAITLTAGTVSPSAAAEQAMVLSQSRDQVSINDDVVRLGDLFTNTGAKARLVVDRAPGLGRRTIYDVRKLAAIAQGHNLYWQAKSWQERVVVERESQTIGQTDILRVVHAALEEKGLDGKWEIDLVSRNLSITLPVNKAATLAVETLRLNRRSRQFTAVVSAPAGEAAAQRLTVSGKVHRLVDVPVLNRRMAHGDVIRRTDLNWISMRADRLGRDSITESAHIVGQTPKRMLAADRPVRAGDVELPMVVSKGGIVTMVLATPHMILTSKGRAMEKGAKGDTIKVMNLKSKTVIEGEITGVGRVLVTTAILTPLGPTARR